MERTETRKSHTFDRFKFSSNFHSDLFSIVLLFLDFYPNQLTFWPLISNLLIQHNFSYLDNWIKQWEIKTCIFWQTLLLNYSYVSREMDPEEHTKPRLVSITVKKQDNFLNSMAKHNLIGGQETNAMKLSTYLK